MTWLDTDTGADMPDSEAYSLERIADALERIANYLEKKRCADEFSFCLW